MAPSALRLEFKSPAPLRDFFPYLKLNAGTTADIRFLRKLFCFSGGYFSKRSALGIQNRLEFE
jgi:hypothetical protein